MALVPYNPTNAISIGTGDDYDSGDYKFSGYSDLGKLTKKIENLK